MDKRKPEQYTATYFGLETKKDYSLLISKSHSL